jgi:hypothetical protein
VIRAASSLRGLDPGDHEIFALHFTWSAGMRTSLHKHSGFELVLVRSGRVHAIVDGTRLSAGPTEFIELPAGSAHAIWSEVEATFDVLGQRGLGLTMLVPDGSGQVKDVTVYGSEGPWRQDPPAGMAFTTQAEMEQLRSFSHTLF